MENPLRNAIGASSANPLPSGDASRRPPEVMNAKTKSGVKKKTGKKKAKSLVRKGGRGLGFFGEEIKDLLTTIEDMLPCDTHEWDAVAAHHQVKWKRNRTATSLKKKWNTLHNAAPPTGDPNVPENVKWALRIKSKIADRANLIGETENDDLDIVLENEGNEIEVVDPDESQGNVSNEVLPSINTQARRGRPICIPREEKNVNNNVTMLELIKTNMELEKMKARTAELERAERKEMFELQLKERQEQHRQQMEVEKEKSKRAEARQARTEKQLETLLSLAINQATRK